ncbi:uncharacterized protein LTR77_006922 [Saxophila tyrrhenica]|uniref:Peptidase A1 domain-containing protein n=1 Tax=Saxophila tyrrhenica TaxID=1690608 RepID=A0AAV9P657_9PEZI|nr:hypothetical protein LTR77_006922 [Saxophila tyrrhenica]
MALMAHGNLAICVLLATMLHFANAACPAPISLPVSNVDFFGGSSRRGIAISIGSPVQQFSFAIDGAQNNSWVYRLGDNFRDLDTGESRCNSPAQCTTLRGGLYNPNISSTARIPTDQAIQEDLYFSNAEQDAPEVISVLNGTAVQDGIRVGSTTIEKYMFGMIWQIVWALQWPQNTLGLGSGSTLLSALKSAELIASSSYAYYNGFITDSDDDRDGQIVFGGYDEARSTGANVTHALEPSTEQCPTGMWLDLHDLVLTFPNGTSPSLLQGVTIRACVVPQLSAVMALATDPYWIRFEEYTETQAEGYVETAINWGTTTYDSNDVYDGGLRIDLGSGVVVDITNDMLVSVGKTIAPGGGLYLDDETSAVLIQNDDAFITPLIGRQFFAAAQLFVDYEAGTFTVSPVEDTTDSNLIAVGKDCAAASDVKPPDDSGGNNGNDQQNHEDGTDGDKHVKPKGLTGGEIAGIVVGVIAALAIVAAIAFYFFRRRRRTDTRESSSSFPEAVGASPQGAELQTKPVRQLSMSKTARSWFRSSEPKGDFSPSTREMQGSGF